MEGVGARAFVGMAVRDVGCHGHLAVVTKESNNINAALDINAVKNIVS